MHWSTSKILQNSVQEIKFGKQSVLREGRKAQDLTVVKVTSYEAHLQGKFFKGLNILLQVGVPHRYSVFQSWKYIQTIGSHGLGVAMIVEPAIQHTS